jgi:hypothetical protein
MQKLSYVLVSRTGSKKKRNGGSDLEAAMDFKITSGKEALKFWALEAIERDANNQSFTDEEVTTIFGSLEKVFGSEEASGFLNKVIETHRAYEQDNNMTFNRSVVKTLATMARGGEGGA